MCGWFSNTPYWAPGSQPRHVLWLGIEPVTLWFTGGHSIHWATPAWATLQFAVAVQRLTSEHSENLIFHLHFRCFLSFSFFLTLSLLLKTSSLCLFSWRIFSLDLEFWLHGSFSVCFSSTFKMFCCFLASLFTDEKFIVIQVIVYL